MNSAIMNDQLNTINTIKYWLEHTVIGFNFCPFAKREFVRQSIEYKISQTNSQEAALYDLLAVFESLNASESIETSLLIFETGFGKFEDYLDLLEMANSLLEQEGYEGIYQIASFHPNYIFDGTEEEDASNYTNRSPYPVLHILRESSLERVLANLDQPENIPERNIALAQEKGSLIFEKILEKSFHQ